MRIGVTGGSGFIGSNFIQYLLSSPEIKEEIFIVNIDTVTYAGSGKNIFHMFKETRNKKFSTHYRFVQADICNYRAIEAIVKKFQLDVIVNFAAESHNSYAILNPSVFFRTNLLGTQTLLEVCRKKNIRFHHISTCEVYGDLALDSKEKFSEDTPYRPNTPYNASKAAADLAVRAYCKTFGVKATISNCANNYGPYQFPEKLIPLFVTNLLEGKKIPLYKNSQNKREWIHVLDHCKAIYLILKQGRIGETYNVGTGVEKSIEEITNIILTALGKSESMKEYVTDRPGHDRRYLLDCRKIFNELGWKSAISFDHGMQETIEWYTKNMSWWKPLTKNLIAENKWNGKK
ncbi:MAG: dTDP-glucose 4,6-dehydratase [archaeon]|jgi:dTDP-glucose 4,6-dehydratase